MQKSVSSNQKANISKDVKNLQEKIGKITAENFNLTTYYNCMSEIEKLNASSINIQQSFKEDFEAMNVQINIANLQLELTQKKNKFFNKLNDIKDENALVAFLSKIQFKQNESENPYKHLKTEEIEIIFKKIRQVQKDSMKKQFKKRLKMRLEKENVPEPTKEDVDIVKKNIEKENEKKPLTQALNKILELDIMKDINTLKIQKYYKKYSNKKFHNTILNFLKPTATELDLEKVSGTTNNVFKITENDTILGFNKQLPFNENSNFNLAYSAREIIGVSLMDAMNHIIPEDSYMSFYKGNFDAASHQYFSKNVGKHGDLNNIFLDAMGSFAQENSENFNTQKTDYVKEQLETIFSTLVEGQLLDYNETNILNLSLDKYLTKFSKFQNQGYTLADVVDKYQCKSQYMKIKKSLHNLKDFIETIESNQEEKIYALSAINLFIFFIEKTEKLREMAPFIGDIRDKNVVPEINEGGNFVKFHIIDFWVDLDRLTKEINSNKGKFDKVLETFTHNFLKHSSQHFISSLLNLEDQFVKFNGHPISKTWGEVFQEFLTTVGQERWDVAMKQVFEETRQNLNSNILQKLTFEDFIEFMEKRKKEKSSQLDRDDVPTLYTKQQMDLFFLTKKQEHKQQIQPKKLKLEDAWRRITLKQKHTYNPYTAKKVFKFGDQFNSAINANQKRDPIRNLDSKQLETQKALQE